MDQESDAAEPFEEAQHDEVEIRSISDWIWKPWYAKLWWALIPIYWLGAFLARSLSVLDVFYSSALAGFINVFMLPPTALIVLAAGFLRQWTRQIDWSSMEPSDHDPFGRSDRGPTGLPRFIDPIDPRSGGCWIGNPENPLNPAYPHSHRHHR